MSEKTHYRKVFKSDHLGVADLEDMIEAKQTMTFTIKHVKQEIGAKVAGKKINCNIAYFEEKIKPLVLNAGNSKILKGFAGNSPYVEDWSGIAISLYIDNNAKLKGEIVGGVRIHPNKPQKKPQVTPQNVKLWNNAKTAYKRDGNLHAVCEKADITSENQAKLITECEADV